MSIVTEKELIDAIAAGLPGVTVIWGFLDLESASTPPSLPVVCVTRVSAAAETGTNVLADMCDSSDQFARIIVQVDTWEKEYEDARNLNEQVHTIVASILDPQQVWTWQADVDRRNVQLKAWCIESTWTSNGER